MAFLYENLLTLFTASGVKMLIMWIIGGITYLLNRVFHDKSE